MEKIKNKKISIIGAGNMGKAITLGLLSSGLIKKNNLIVADISNKKLSFFKKNGIKISKFSKEIVSASEIIILAVKPQDLFSLLEEIKKTTPEKSLIISAVAGVKVKKIKKYFKTQAVVRVMANLCASINMSVSCWSVSSKITREEKETAKTIFKALGDEYFIKKENLLEEITAISGSGPAYIFYLAKILKETAQKMGIRKDLAEKISIQTIAGSGLLIKSSNKKPTELIDAVASKGGITEEVIANLEKFEFSKKFEKALFLGLKKLKKFSDF